MFAINKKHFQKLGCFLAWQTFFFTDWPRVDSNHNVVFWLPVLDHNWTQKSTKHKAFHSRTIKVWDMVLILVLFHPAQMFPSYRSLSKDQWSVSCFNFQVWTRLRKQQSKSTDWDNVQKICCHKSCCCFKDFQCTDCFLLHVLLMLFYRFSMHW